MSKDLYISSLLDIYGRFLSEKQKSLTEHYYNEDLSLSEIAENEGITRQGVSDNIRRAESKMRVWEEECGFCESFLRLKELSLDAEKGSSAAIKEILEIINNL
ncbi:MAG: DNA-binding protein [Clostridia bacterium]|nr:DNA-binding protein [Clostridia bacterium]